MSLSSFAFLDFLTPELATSALIDPHNYSLDGRQLKLEFASPDAVRRGGNVPKREKETKDGDRGQHLNKRTKSEGAVAGRAKPGAALSSAQREQTAIVASQGKKIVFA